MVTAADAARAEIIRFWHTVEMFSPPSVDKVSRERRVFAVRPGEPLPWEPQHELAGMRLKKDQAWRHVVYVGIFSLESVFEILMRVFEPDEESFDERPDGESALAAFVVSGEGCGLIGSEVLSSCAWATGRLLSPGPGTPGWLSGFDMDRARFSADFAELMGVDPDDPSRFERELGDPIDARMLAACRDLAATAVGAGSVLPNAEIRIRSEIVAKRNAHSTDGHDFLNSFIADDLALVAGRVRQGDAGPALREYLRPNAELDLSRRMDVRERLDVVLEATAPFQVPLGRWPSKPEHPLASSQQLAVDHALRMLDAGSGIVGVNGPPGTGKTTMLRDLIAAIVVERARRLTALPHPRDAFSGEQRRWKTGDYTRVVHLWKPELTGFEMVVASKNNGAVENVTNEIPAAGAIDDSWRDDAADLDYFADIGSALLSVDDEEGSDRGVQAAAAWALVAARLGNKRNRGKFVEAFWYRKPADESEEDRGLLAIMKDYEQSSPTRTWREAVAEFTKSYDRAASVQRDRAHAKDCLARLDTVEQAMRLAEESFAKAERRANAVTAEIAELRRAANQAATDREGWLTARSEHHLLRPGFFARLLWLGAKTRNWRERDRYLADKIVITAQFLDTARDMSTRLARDQALAAHAAGEAKEVYRRCLLQAAAVRSTVDQARSRLGHQFPDADWWRDRRRRELTALWTDPEWNQARSQLFLAALALHKAFLEQVPTEMRQSLHAAADVVSGAAPRELPEETALAAWQALFFVVPVVSTTFASFARVFSQLGRESLGWLFVDEAGQATPQEAVGALWRSKRAVIVGDPLQLEPITTLPFRAEQAIRVDHGVDEQWLTSRTSVQRLADQLTPLGTWLPGSDGGKIWVGAPLTVHRRCDQPMFGIVNDVAYDGLMIDGTAASHAAEFAEAYPALPASKWIDVVSEQSQGHWIPDEGRQLDRIIATLFGLDFDMSEVMVIAPFRDIARRIRGLPGMVSGTVHTAQGKQADIVILVLGSDPRKRGARSWAARKPNLLNVAVSRAKRRLYVIGNRQLWADLSHFTVLAHRLPHGPPVADHVASPV